MHRRQINIQTMLSYLCAALLVQGALSPAALGQEVCKTTPPVLYPNYTDSNKGWNVNQVPDVVKGRIQMVLGDIDGDGQDELIATPWESGRIDLWRWEQSTWTPMLPFPVDSFRNAYPYELALANVTGRKAKDLVVHMASKTSVLEREDVFSYDPASLSWNLVATAPIDATREGRSLWFKGGKTSSIDSRFRVGASSSSISYLLNGQWASQGAIGLDRSKLADCSRDYLNPCIAFADVNRDNLTDLVARYKDGTFHIFPSTAGTFFGGRETISAMRVPESASGSESATFQLGDVDEDGFDELIFVTNANTVAVHYFDTAANDFRPWPDAGNVQRLAPGDLSTPYFHSLTVAPMGAGARGVVVVTPSGIKKLIYISTGGTPGTVNLAITPNADISGNNGFNKENYLSYFRVGTIQGGLVMLARSSDGIKTIVGRNSSSFRAESGYPSYTGIAQTTAYATIGRLVGTGPDIRAIYPNIGVPWASVQFRLVGLKVPAAPTEITAAAWTQAFERVRNQTIEEVTALQATHLLYSATGDFFTKTYLVKDAALSQVTQALNLPGNPDIGAQVLGGITDGLSLLGGLTSLGGSVLKLAEKVAARLEKANAFIGMISSIGGTIGTYAAPEVADIATGAYNLKTTLDNISDASQIANSCSLGGALRNWTQSKPLADGLLNGQIYADPETQEDIVRTGQAAYKAEVWKSLAPTKWEAKAIGRDGLTDAGVNKFFGRDNYPVEYSAIGNCRQADGTVVKTSFVLIDTSTNNFPGREALDALFKAAPDGVGATPRDVLLGLNGWNIPKGLGNLNILINTGLNIRGCQSVSAASTLTTSPLPEPGVESRKPIQVSSVATDAEVTPSADLLLENLIADVKNNLGDGEVRDRLGKILVHVGYQLRNAQARQQPPTDAIRILDMFIVQSLAQAETEREMERTQASRQVTAAVKCKNLLQTQAAAREALNQ